jgi:hypothetical protein
MQTQNTPNSTPTFSAGSGLHHPHCHRVVLTGADLVAALADELRQLNPAGPRWWSPHVWRGDHRRAERWASTCAIAIDLDYYSTDGKHCAPPETARAELQTTNSRPAHSGASLHFWGIFDSDSATFALSLMVR